MIGKTQLALALLDRQPALWRRVIGPPRHLNGVAYAGFVFKSHHERDQFAALIRWKLSQLALNGLDIHAANNKLTPAWPASFDLNG